ncbi:hypothetical protein [Streptomyces sp. NPDC051644]
MVQPVAVGKAGGLGIAPFIFALPAMAGVSGAVHGAGSTVSGAGPVASSLATVRTRATTGASAAEGRSRPMH